jgi:hypothetical protein
MTREDIHRKFIKDIGIVQRGEYQGYYCDEVHNMIDYMFDEFYKNLQKNLHLCSEAYKLEQAKRTCESCKHHDTDMDEDCDWDGYCNVLGDYFNRTFYCKMYEPKDLIEE